jgi:hypothetical protein
VRSELDNGRAEDIATSGSNNFRRVLPESSVNRDSLAGYVSNVNAVQCRPILCPCEPFSRLHSRQNTMLLPCIGRSRPCAVYHMGPDEETKRGESGIEQVLF